jgi:hypothetical protein
MPSAITPGSMMEFAKKYGIRPRAASCLQKRANAYDFDILRTKVLHHKCGTIMFNRS